jgi:hypothetical protein
MLLKVVTHLQAEHLHIVPRLIGMGTNVGQYDDPRVVSDSDVDLGSEPQRREQGKASDSLVAEHIQPCRVQLQGIRVPTSAKPLSLRKPTLPVSKALINASSSTTPPRAVLIRILPCFIIPNCSVPKQPLVLSLSGRCSETKSDVWSNSSSV